MRGIFKMATVLKVFLLNRTPIFVPVYAVFLVLYYQQGIGKLLLEEVLLKEVQLKGLYHAILLLFMYFPACYSID